MKKTGLFAFCAPGAAEYAWNRHGVVCEVAGSLMDAMASYDKAVSLDPKFADAWFNRGDAHRKLGMLTGALRGGRDVPIPHEPLRRGR